MGDVTVQVEYMLVEDDDAPLLKADAYIKSKLRTFFSEVFDSFKLFLGRLLSEADLGSQVSKELLLEKVSDLLWASRILPRVGLNPELVDFWSSASSDVIRVLNSEKLEEVLWDTKCWRQLAMAVSLSKLRNAPNWSKCGSHLFEIQHPFSTHSLLQRRCHSKWTQISAKQLRLLLSPSFCRCHLEIRRTFLWIG
jgi:hypothetical protein